MGGLTDASGAGQDIAAPDAFLLEDLVRAAAVRSGADEWRMRADRFWFRLEPPKHVGRRQGWKLHVSATPLSAAVVLARTAPVLFERGCSFKFARSLEQVSHLVSTRCDRGSGGKFLTAYPDDDEHFREVAQLLDRATTGLPGPAVLSDRPYRPGSQVYYRYGAFLGLRRLSNDGSYEAVLEAPDGSPVRDSRRAWFSPPAWAPSPFPEGVAAPAAPQRPDVVLLNGRYAVRRALQHANKGGVYLAEDRLGTDQVVVKQARPHVGSSLTGADVRDALRNEARVLDLLQDDGIAPRRLELFEKSGSLFLVEEFLDGQNLDSWVRHRLLPRTDHGLDLARAREMSLRLVALVEAVHARGLVLRDLKPGNLIVSPDGAVRLIDLEHVCVPGEAVSNAYTVGYAPPEQITAGRFGPALGPRADLYALGATLYFLVSGVPPLLPQDEAQDGDPARSADARLRALTTAMSRLNTALRTLAEPILGLLAEDPEQRWDLGRVRRFLERPGPAPVPVTAAAAPPRDALDRALRDGLDHLVATARYEDPEQLWDSSEFGAGTDRCSVQHGAAGVLAVLTRAAAEEERLREPVRRTAEWLRVKVRQLPRLLPGLYFGSAGTAVALFEAGRLLGDEEMAAEALDLAAAIPLDWPNPDVCHGLAGAGLAQLQLWQATGDTRFEDGVRRCADQLVECAEPSGQGVFWSIPRTFDSALAGLSHYGFGHGVAGVGAFLLAAGLETGDQSCLRLARAAGETLLAAAGPDDGCVTWPSERGKALDPVQPMALHWCSGVSGIGTFLVRLWSATGEERFAVPAEQAGTTVRYTRWQASPAACHGLAGNGELLLDLAEAFPDRGHRAGAEEIAEAILVRDVLRDGRRVWPDDTQREVIADYGTGLAGVLGFLLRLRDFGPRLWLPAFRAPAEAGAAR
ncbi:class III lanthionine synthetase LanKC [Kitasatospora cystarginea]|uniref:Class III lanthionine synthetase LanKC n=2 Tax=Kitasatospora cystarginea TaxID=58350 RepID=A0ABN3DD13_9ACTN